MFKHWFWNKTLVFLNFAWAAFLIIHCSRKVVHVTPEKVTPDWKFMFTIWEKCSCLSPFSGIKARKILFLWINKSKYFHIYSSNFDKIVTFLGHKQTYHIRRWWKITWSSCWKINLFKEVYDLPKKGFSLLILVTGFQITG